MALRPVLGVARVALNGTMNGIGFANIFHVRHDPAETAWSSPTVTALATAMRGYYVARFIPILNSSVLLGDCVVIDLSSETGASAVASGSTAGGSTTLTGAQSSAQCISWKINRRYRGGHPRTYLPPPGGSAAITTGHTWSAGTVTAAKAAAAAFLGDVNGGDFGGVSGDLCCVHRYKDGVELATPLVDLIVGSDFDTRVDTQRRRLGRDR
jgi:hypothetical protein